LEVRGELEASGLTSGTILVKAGGHLKGTIQTAHLIVEDGGGLTATLNVGPHISSEPAPRRAEPRAETAMAPVAPPTARRKTRMPAPATTRKK
jgi:cytoskeletal protein CcmA (bactofilin family)